MIALIILRNYYYYYYYNYIIAPCLFKTKLQKKNSE